MAQLSQSFKDHQKIQDINMADWSGSNQVPGVLTIPELMAYMVSICRLEFEGTAWVKYDSLSPPSSSNRPQTERTPQSTLCVSWGRGGKLSDLISASVQET